MRIACLAGAAFLIAGVACSSNSSSPSADFVGKFCGMIQPCCAQAGLSTSGQLCNEEASSSAAAATYDAAAGQACLSGMQTEQSNGTLCSTLGDDIPACQQAFSQATGNVPPGGACQQDSDCAPEPGGGATCFDQFNLGDAGTSQTLTCIQTSDGQAGSGPCIGTRNGATLLYSWSGNTPVPTTAVVCDVASNLTCNATTHECVTLNAVGQPCNTDSDCVPSAFCSYTSGAGQCTTRLADGASCANAPSGCQTTSACDSTTQTCKPLLADGAACTTGEECQSFECVNGACGSGAAGFGLAILCGSN
jgi:hypothetical protein